MKEQQTITPVILSGGSGKRLWPFSRKDRPKQYLKLFSEFTMLQETILRLKGIENITEPIIVCNKEHRFFVAEQCKQIGIENAIILLEPLSRNTAPAITAAAIYASKNIQSSSLLVLSSDHLIRDKVSFSNAIKSAISLVDLGNLVVFGVTPTEAHTGYGYIELSSKQLKDSYKVARFIEKPKLKKAKFFLDQGGYLWNSGIFLFGLEKLIDELFNFEPDLVSSVRKSVELAKSDLDFIRLDEDFFSLSLDISIDYALMEKSQNIAVVPLDAGWSDIGSWSSLFQSGVKNEDNNVIFGEVYTEKTEDSLIRSSESHLIVANDLKNLIIVNTPDITFISSKKGANEVSSILDNLQKATQYKIESNRKVFRPWGWYDSIDLGENFQVKRIHVNPGSKLSLQSHNQRAEHWVVIKGVAQVMIDGKKNIIIENQSIFVPIKSKHSLENKDNNNFLEIIEVQSGTYFGEDDIIRYEDVYGRTLNE
jgi:mannose-1-phosphate guanylyltransferase/mannose-6-phosphate isomerase